MTNLLKRCSIHLLQVLPLRIAKNIRVDTTTGCWLWTGNQHLVAKYFNEDPKAFEQVDVVLKDASYGDSPDGKP